MRSCGASAAGLKHARKALSASDDGEAVGRSQTATPEDAQMESASLGKLAQLMLNRLLITTLLNAPSLGLLVIVVVSCRRPVFKFTTRPRRHRHRFQTAPQTARG
jgi:hypothetical protein